MVFFWACEVTETKAAAVKIPDGFVLNVCNATANDKDVSSVSLGLETTQMDDKVWKGVVAHLGAKPNMPQFKLDLVFGGSTQVKFYIAQGTGKVHLTGYFQPGPEAMYPEMVVESVHDLADSQAEPVQHEKKGKKRSREDTNNIKSKKNETVTWDQNESSDSDEEKPVIKKLTEPSKTKEDNNKSNVKPQQTNNSTPEDGKKKKNRKKKHKGDKK